MRAILFSACLSLASSALAAPAPAQETEAIVEKPVADLLAEVPLVDGHNDLIIHYIDWATGMFRTADAYDIRQRTKGQSDIPRMRQGHLGAAIFTIWTGEDDKPEPGLEASIELLRELVRRSPDDLAIVTSPDELLAAHAGGKISIMMGLEGGNPVEGDVSRLAWMRDRGVVEMGLVWSSNGLGRAGRFSAKEQGLSTLGREVVREMNRLGMIVDVSHASAATVRDVAAITTVPIIDTHAVSARFTDEDASLTDQAMRAVAGTGGIVMPMFMPDATDRHYRAWMVRRDAAFSEVAIRLLGEAGKELVPFLPWPTELEPEMAAWIAANPPPVLTLAGIADVYDDVRGVVGIDHIGIGSDFDGMGFHPSGWHPALKDVSQVPLLLAELRRRGWSDSDLRKLTGENFLRVWRAIRQGADR